MKPGQIYFHIAHVLNCGGCVVQSPTDRLPPVPDVGVRTHDMRHMTHQRGSEIALQFFGFQRIAAPAPLRVRGVCRAVRARFAEMIGTSNYS